MNDKVFVFGSNLAGRHGKGAALFALKERGAIYGQGIGLQGDSYAIPTKDRGFKTLPLYHIDGFWKDFCKHALCSNRAFEITPFGTGLAGLPKDDIWKMIREDFKQINYLKDNLHISDSWFENGWIPYE